MKLILTSAIVLAALTATAQVTTLTPGKAAPAISLSNVDGRSISFESFPGAKGYIVVFTCNTCPVAKAYEQRIIALNNKYAASGFPVIAVNPNDPELSAGDSFDKMKERAKSSNYQFPYLYDKGQVVTDAYGAKNTPHIFLVQHKSDGNIIAYTGAIDNDPENNKTEKTSYLEQAIQAISEGKEPALASTKAIGCGVKRKQ